MSSGSTFWSENSEHDQKISYISSMITPKQVQQIKNITDKIQPTLVGVFGSYARGEEDETSDLDLLIDFDQKIDLLEIIGLEQELSEILGVKVDLVTRRSINDALKIYIEADLIRIV